VNPFEFLDEFFVPKLESLSYPSVKISCYSLRRFHSVPACARQTDGQTDGLPIVASTGLAATLTPCKNLIYTERLKRLKLPSLELRRLYNDLTWCYNLQHFVWLC